MEAALLVLREDPSAKFVFVACNAWNSTQATWLDQQLAAATTYTFVVRHEGTAAMSQVLRVAVSKVRIPRSQRSTLELPCATRYSADISSSLMVAQAKPSKNGLRLGQCTSSN